MGKLRENIGLDLLDWATGSTYNGDRVQVLMLKKGNRMLGTSGNQEYWFFINLTKIS